MYKAVFSIILLIIIPVFNSFSQDYVHALNKIEHLQDKEYNLNSHYYFYVDKPEMFVNEMTKAFGQPKFVGEDQKTFKWEGYGPKNKLWYTEYIIFTLEFSDVTDKPSIKKGNIKGLGKFSGANYMHHKWSFVAQYFEDMLKSLGD